MDGSHFKRIFLPFHGKLYRVAVRFLGNQSDAEDMVQETYIKLWQKRHELEALINPESFAVTVLKNSCLDFLRKVKPHQISLSEFQIPATAPVAEQIEKKEALGYIQKIMQKLPFKQQQVVEMKIWNNLSDNEIEQRTGLTKGNIKVMVSRARKTIKNHYFNWEQDDNRR